MDSLVAEWGRSAVLRRVGVHVWRVPAEVYGLQHGLSTQGDTLYPTPYVIHPTHAPCALHPTPYTLHLTPYTLQPTPYTLDPQPLAPNPKP